MSGLCSPAKSRFFASRKTSGPNRSTRDTPACIFTSVAFQPIENHAAIGCLCTTALVAIDGMIDFFCFPSFDSPTVFGALLDDRTGGRFSLVPGTHNLQVKQMYLDETNVLVTRFLSNAAASEVTDFMPVTAATQKNRIVRIVRSIHGDAKFEVNCQPAFDYARSRHKTECEDGSIVFVPENTDCPAMRLSATVPLAVREDAATVTFTLRKGETAVFLFGAAQDVEAQIDKTQVDRDLEDTLTYWRSWISKSSYKGRWRETVNRSALALKLLTSREHGASVAAATFGLPETLGGSRNWDYRYVWLRDSAFALYAFMRLSLREEAEEFWSWMANVLPQTPQGPLPLQIMYGIDGRHELKEETLDHLSGYCDSRPVRIGNGAWNQIQLDVFGELMDAVYIYSKYGHSIDYDRWQGVQQMLHWLGENWEKPDAGIWEVRAGEKHLLHSRLMCWVAFDRAIRLAGKRSLSAPLEDWYKHRDAIVHDIYKNFWSDELKSFVQSKGSKTMDASVLLMPLMRFISPVDPRWLSTLDAVEKTLAEDAFVYRYRNTESNDGLEGEEGSFTCCSFWFVECLARANQVNKARQLFEKLLAHANHVGLFSEELGRDGHQLGNFPQGLTHLALISAASYLDRRLSGEAQEAWG